MRANGKVKLGKAGVLVGGEIALLVSGGYQMFLRTPSGKELPALASQLKTLHAFDEDLREALGLTSLYNVSLGTTADEHLYDRVEDRTSRVHPRPWEKKTPRSVSPRSRPQRPGLCICTSCHRNAPSAGSESRP